MDNLQAKIEKNDVIISKNDIFIAKNENIIKVNEYEKIVMKVKSLSRKFFLPYLLNVYVVLPDQNPQYVRLLRKDGKKVSYKNGEYKLLISRHKVSHKSKLRLVQMIFNLTHKNSTLYDEIFDKFIKSAIPVKNGNFNSTEYMLVLDNLATFLISNNDNSDFLNDTLKRKQQRYELFSYKEDINYAAIPNLIINNKQSYTKHITNRPKMQVKRWKKCKTYKMNDLLKNLEPGYIAKWCYVNEDNEFYFNGTKYKVESEIYYKTKYGQYIYDQILVIKESNNLNFYTMDIDKIDKDKILVPLK
jgi:hypothetical protein